MAIQYLFDVTKLVPTYHKVTMHNCKKFSLTEAEAEKFFPHDTYKSVLTNLLEQCGPLVEANDVVTLDYSMPNLTDIKVLAERLQEISYQTIERIMITGKQPQGSQNFTPNYYPNNAYNNYNYNYSPMYD